MNAPHWRDLTTGTRVRVTEPLHLDDRRELAPPSKATVVATFAKDDLVVFVEAEGYPGSRFRFDDTDGWRVHGEGGRFVGLELLVPPGVA